LVVDILVGVLVGRLVVVLDMLVEHMWAQENNIVDQKYNMDKHSNCSELVVHKNYKYS
jgi:hypothetical protein